MTTTQPCSTLRQILRASRFFCLIGVLPLLALPARAVLGQNDAPVLDTTRSPVLNPVFKGTGSPSSNAGTLVSRLVDFPSPSGQLDNVTDSDSSEGEASASLGIAITAADTVNGTWFYSLNNGGSWTPLGTLSNTNALLLSANANTRLYFQPTATFSGTIASAITFRAWDGSAGTPGGIANTSTNGGTTAFSTATDTAAITVIPNIEFRASATAKTSGTAASAIAISKPSGTIQGDVMLGAFVYNSISTTITPPTGWTLVRKTNSASHTLAVYWKAAGASEGATYTWTLSSAASIAGGIGSFSGVTTNSPINAEAGTSTASTTTVPAPSITPTLPKTMLVTWHSFASAATWTPPFGMTEFVDVMDSLAAGANGVSMEGNYFFEITTAATGTQVAVASNFPDVAAAESIALRPLNQAPVLDATKNPVLKTEDTNAVASNSAIGTAITNLVGFSYLPTGMKNVADYDIDAVLGVAIIGADTANGSWFYSNDHSTWTPFPAVSDSSALLLTGWVYFRPNANFTGYITNALTFRAWDTTTGTTGTTVAITATGDNTAFSTEADSAAINVNGVSQFSTFSNATNQPNQNFAFTLNSAPGNIYEIQTSVDLTNWFPWQIITNSTGSTAISNVAATNSAQFYRLVFVP